MIDESRVADAGALSPRAAVALLTLQLRSALQEAAAAEAEVASVDVDAALWQLRSRLGPLMEDRRRALADDLVAEQDHADALIAAARAEAEQAVADARSCADAAAVHRARMDAARRGAMALAARQAAIAAALPRVAELPVAESPTLEPPAVELPTLEPPVLEPPTLEPPAAEAPDAGRPALFDDPLLDWYPKLAPDTLPPPSGAPFLVPTIIEASTDEPAEAMLQAPHAPIALPAPPSAASIAVAVIETPVDDSVRAAEPPVPTSTMMLPVVVTDAPPGSPDPQAMHVVIDAESFGRAFAAAMAPVFAAMNQGSTHAQYPPPGWVPVQAPVPKKSFWAHAWHPDVLLSGLAMVIVIIVLIAWTG